MINKASENYKIKHSALMEKYEKLVRLWLSETCNKEVSDIIPFYRDGVVCPDVWFKENNSFRPLIILKEVSTGEDTIEGLHNYNRLWGNKKYFDFATYLFDDIRIGTFRQWKRIARLVKGLEEIHNGNHQCQYDYDFSFKDGGLTYTGDIEGYKKHNNQRTANTLYTDTTDKMAVLEIKKVGGGTSAGTELSIATGYYKDHIEPFKDLLVEQIKLINPTLIICCGIENGNCISKLLEDIKNQFKDIPWIDGCHHARSSNINFYEKPMKSYIEYLHK